jgi:hypothetical protein
MAAQDAVSRPQRKDTVMVTTLQDATLQRDPTARHAFPEVRSEAALRAPRTLAEDLLAEFRDAGTVAARSFKLASHGGYARTVTGTVAYLDEEAETFMVRGSDGALQRVPLRDIVSARPWHPSGSAPMPMPMPTSMPTSSPSLTFPIAYREGSGTPVHR